MNHILSLYGAKVAAFARKDTNFEIRLDREERDHAVYIDTSEPGVSNIAGPQYEQRYILSRKVAYMAESMLVISMDPLQLEHTV